MLKGSWPNWHLDLGVEDPDLDLKNLASTISLPQNIFAYNPPDARISCQIILMHPRPQAFCNISARQAVHSGGYCVHCPVTTPTWTHLQGGRVHYTQRRVAQMSYGHVRSSAVYKLLPGFFNE